VEKGKEGKNGGDEGCGNETDWNRRRLCGVLPQQRFYSDISSLNLP
jgi:endo-beta-N-acetylglucosaminidase D